MSSDINIHLNDIGTLFQATILSSSGTPINLSLYDEKKFIFKKPSGENYEANSSFVTDGSDGKLQYNMASGVLDEIGTWQLQVFLRIASTQNYTEVDKFKVNSNLRE